MLAYLEATPYAPESRKNTFLKTPLFSRFIITSCLLFPSPGIALPDEKNTQLSIVMLLVDDGPLVAPSNSTRIPSKYRYFRETCFTGLALCIFLAYGVDALITAIPLWVPWSFTEPRIVILRLTRYSPRGKKTLLLSEPATWLTIAWMADVSSTCPSPTAAVKEPPGCFTLVIPAGTSSNPFRKFWAEVKWEKKSLITVLRI